MWSADFCHKFRRNGYLEAFNVLCVIFSPFFVLFIICMAPHPNVILISCSYAYLDGLPSVISFLGWTYFNP